jgi:hypothetical protein
MVRPENRQRHGTTGALEGGKPKDAEECNGRLGRVGGIALWLFLATPRLAQGPTPTTLAPHPPRLARCSIGLTDLMYSWFVSVARLSLISESRRWGFGEVGSA